MGYHQRKRQRNVTYANQGGTQGTNAFGMTVYIRAMTRGVTARQCNRLSQCPEAMRGHRVGGPPYAGASRVCVVRVAEHDHTARMLAVEDEPWCCRRTRRWERSAFPLDDTPRVWSPAPVCSCSQGAALVEFHVAAREADITHARQRNTVVAVGDPDECRGIGVG